MILAHGQARFISNEIGHCEGAKCYSYNDCSGDLTCNDGTCGPSPYGSYEPEYQPEYKPEPKPEYHPEPKPEYHPEPKPEYKKPEYKKPEYKKPEYKKPEYKKPEHKEKSKRSYLTPRVLRCGRLR